MNRINKIYMKLPPPPPKKKKATERWMKLIFIFVWLLLTYVQFCLFNEIRNVNTGFVMLKINICIESIAIFSY